MLYEFDSGQADAPDQEDGADLPASRIYIFKMFLAKEKALYKNLNNLKLES